MSSAPEVDRISGRDPAESRQKPYHHGDLRAALLASAEAELAARGVEGFSLRAVARRAGVSHAAPAHHFNDADGVLTALATLSFDRFAASMRKEADAAGDDPTERLVAITLAYIDYAAGAPAMFDLQFGSTRPDRNDPALCAASADAFAVLRECVEAVLTARGEDLGRTSDAAAIVWAAAHGIAALFASRPTPLFGNASAEERRAAFARIARRIAGAI